MALQADNKTFLLRLCNSEISPLTVSESEAISLLASKETSEAAPIMSAARHTISTRVERSRVGSNAKVDVSEVSEVCEIRSERRSLNKHLLMNITELGLLQSDASNRAKIALASE